MPNALRSTMSDLIARTRLLMADTAAADQDFQDQDVQDTLDRRRTDVNYQELRGKPTIDPSSRLLLYYDYYSNYPDWEDDVKIQHGSDWAVLTPDVSDNVVGHWTFTDNTLPPVFIVGKTYDLYAAAADLLEIWLVRAKCGAFDVRLASGTTFHRSQKFIEIQKLINQYRLMQRPIVTDLDRNDWRHPPSTVTRPWDSDQF